MEHKTACCDSFRVIGKNEQNTQVAVKYILGRSDSEVHEARINKKTFIKTTGHQTLVTVDKCVSVASSIKVQAQRPYTK